MLVFECWPIEHVTYLKLRNMLLQDEKMHKMTTISLKMVKVVILSIAKLVTIVFFSQLGINHMFHGETAKI